MDKEDVAHIMEYSAALKEKEFLSHATTWMNIKDITLNKLVTREQMLYDFHSDEVVRLIKTENRKLVAKDGGNRDYCIVGTEFQFCKMKKF